uniref:Uncharacterized protein n=1 Tax=Rhodosorus marinus TaxID=101924 RepID=A0A7S2ZLW4_9RHOD|mmetsp:Transcript_24416/g.96313  ORF Transcript_24416/g.96313 Transcript_24416/m.96313 type:complete len:250 (+) Transcript_24416:440-1189(+)
MGLREFDYGPLVSVEGGSEETIRERKRQWNELRPLFMRTRMVSQAAGSSYIEAENSKVICSVSGPLALTGGRTEAIERAKISCYISRTKFCGLEDAELEKRATTEYEGILCRALESIVRVEQYPKSTIEVHVLVIEDDGSTLPAAITCACLALADAKIELRELMACCSVAYANGQLLLDPTLDEEKESSGSVLVSYLATSGKVATVFQTGQLAYDQMAEAVDMTISGAREIAVLVRNCLKQRESKDRGL